MGFHTSTSSSTAAIGILSSEATSLIEQAKKYKAMMDALPAGPEGDEKRKIYEQIITDLLERSRRLNFAITTNVSSS
jgi:hypothetical protein